MDFSELNPKGQNCPSSVQKSTPALNAAGRSSPPKASSLISIATMGEGPARFGTSAQPNVGRTTPTSLASLVTSEPQTASTATPRWTSSTTREKPSSMSASAESRFHDGISSRSTTIDGTPLCRLGYILALCRRTDAGVRQSLAISLPSPPITSLNGCLSVGPGGGLPQLELSSASRWQDLINLLILISRHPDLDGPLLPFYRDAAISRDVISRPSFHLNISPKNFWLVDNCWSDQLLGCCLRRSVGDNLRRMMAMLGFCSRLQDALVPPCDRPCWVGLIGSINIRHGCQESLSLRRATG
ncbi:hypothetical protein B0T14DRAFT_325380 [Immersiella caudata]|uniref:Uncharacterized protein n=1 Tax=Immersiella caudata TaxID=314043 RepID=A0AA39U5C0_9PEZI|nr:hypothetical protein B0T14DRAFT_325380 [Immersiella caudata]